VNGVQACAGVESVTAMATSATMPLSRLTHAKACGKVRASICLHLPSKSALFEVTLASSLSNTPTLHLSPYGHHTGPTLDQGLIACCFRHMPAEYRAS